MIEVLDNFQGVAVPRIKLECDYSCESEITQLLADTGKIARFQSRNPRAGPAKITQDWLVGWYAEQCYCDLMTNKYRLEDKLAVNYQITGNGGFVDNWVDFTHPLYKRPVSIKGTNKYELGFVFQDSDTRVCDFYYFFHVVERGFPFANVRWIYAGTPQGLKRGKLKNGSTNKYAVYPRENNMREPIKI